MSRWIFFLSDTERKDLCKQGHAFYCERSGPRSCVYRDEPDDGIRYSKYKCNFCSEERILKNTDPKPIVEHPECAAGNHLWWIWCGCCDPVGSCSRFCGAVPTRGDHLEKRLMAWCERLSRFSLTEGIR
jgi:hypothetical protein